MSQQSLLYSYALGFGSEVDLGTPFGKVLAKIALPLIAGGCFLWLINNPFALLWQLCHGGPTFGYFLKELLEALSGQVLLYSDEAVPCNVLRPNVSFSGRSS